MNTRRMPSVYDNTPLDKIILSRWKILSNKNRYGTYKYYMVEKGPFGWAFMIMLCFLPLYLGCISTWIGYHYTNKAFASYDVEVQFNPNLPHLVQTRDSFKASSDRQLLYACIFTVLSLIVIILCIIFIKHRTWIGLGDDTISYSFGKKTNTQKQLVFRRDASTQVVVDDCWLLRRSYRVKLIRADGKKKTIFEPMQYDSAMECKEFLVWYLLD